MGQTPRLAASRTGVYRRARVYVSLALFVVLMLVALAVPGWSGAAGGPAFLTQFGENCGDLTKLDNGECRGAGETNGPRGIATNSITGHVFVVDEGNFRISEFTPWGNFVKAFGWDVATGPVDEEQEVRVRAGAGQFRLSFEASSTPDLPFDASAAEVELALNNLTSISSKGAVSVEEVVGNPNGTTPFIYLVSFDGGSLKATDVAQLGIEDGTTPLSGGDPGTSKEASTRANGAAAGTGLETCTAASECKAGLRGTGAGQLDFPQGIAVDSAGGIYVVDRQNLRVQKFDSAGEFVWMIGGEVNKTKSEEVGSTEAQRNFCAAASTDVCQKGAPGTGTGQFSEAWPFFSYIAINPQDDTLYVGDKERIQRFGADGSFLSSIALPAPINTGTVSSLAVGPTGNIWVSTAKDEPIPAEPNVLKLNPAGTEVLCTAAVGKPTAVAVDGGENVYVFASRVNESETENNTSEIRQFDSACTQTASFADHEFDFVSGMGANEAGDVYAGNVSSNGVNSYIRAYGPAPVDYESPPPLPPEILDEYAIAVRPDSAMVGALINPKFWPDAHYYVQYGKIDCNEPDAACKEIPVLPGAPLTGPAEAISAPVATAPVELPGLESNTTYHYRFVAQSSGGGPTLGPGSTFRTHPGSEPPAEGRVNELVSPSLKGSGEVGAPPPAGGAAELTVQPQQATPSGDKLTFHSFTAFGESPESAPASSQYLAQPGGSGSWLTDNINPRFEEGFTSDPFVGFSEDLSRAAMIVPEPPLTPDATEGFPNLYLRDNASGQLTTVTSEDHTPEIGGILPSQYCLFLGGASADYNRIFFGAKGALLEGDPAANGFNLYEWSTAQGVQLVSVLPNEVKAAPSLDTGFGVPVQFEPLCDASSALLRHAVSADGSRAFWHYGGTYAGAKEPLFARVNGSKTVQLDAAQAPATGKGGGHYQDASVDGSVVFFTDEKKLTSQPTTAESTDLYRYDFDKEEGQRLANLTPLTTEKANVVGVVGASADGSYVYFVAQGVLDGEPNSENESAKPKANNLYVWHEGEGPRFLAVLETADQDAWSENPAQQRARVSPDGQHLAFLSRNPLTGIDNEVIGAPGCQPNVTGLTGSPQCAEAFLYDYTADALTCASCSPSGARPHGPSSLPTWSVPYQQPRYLSDDGRRLFFETLDPLDPHDTNGERDVYEFERAGAGACTSASPSYNPETNACTFLISSGKSVDESYFVDASSNGDDAFFSTREPLVFTDQDERYDVYDARVGGSQPPPPPPPCESEGCRGGVTQAPAPSPAGSPSFQGPPDPKPPRKGSKACPKGAHKVKHRGKTRCVKNKRHGKKQKGRGGK